MTPVNSAFELDWLIIPVFRFSILSIVVMKQLLLPSQLKHFTLRGGNLSFVLRIIRCLTSTSTISWLPSQKLMMLLNLLIQSTEPAIVYYWIYFSEACIRVVFVYYIFEQLTMQQAEADKVKYWQYKLQQKKKSQKITQKIKSIKNKTPEKNHKLAYIINSQDDFFNNTLQKFKGFLEENSQRKKGLNMTHSNKAQKKFQTSRSYQLTDTKQKGKKEQKKQKQNKTKIQCFSKKAKQHTDQKQKVHKLTPVKSKSKSRSKSQKYKTDKSRSQIQKIKSKKQLKLSPSNDISKKRSLKTKETTRRFETVVLQSLDDSQEGSWKKRLMDTIIVHKDNSPTINRKQSHFVSHFKIWEEHQQKQFNFEKRNKKIVQKYLKGLVEVMRYNSLKRIKKQKPKKVDFKQIVKSQQKKLLQLKQQLSSLKNAPNLNQSLDFLIGKVNENICSLQNIQGSVHKREVSNFSSRRSEVENYQNSKPNVFIQSEQNDRDTNKTVLNQSQNTVSVAQQNWSLQQIKFEKPETQNVKGKKLNVNELLGRSSNQRQKQSGSFTLQKPSLSFYQQHQSNSLKIDDKFDDITLKPFLDSEQRYSQQSICSPKQESVNNNQSYLNQFLAQEQNKKIEITLNRQIQNFKPIVYEIKEKKQVRQSAKNQIKIIQDEQQWYNPVFTRSKNKKHKNLEEIGSLQFQLTDNASNNMLFNVVKVSEDSLQNQLDDQAEMPQKNHVFELILDQLLSQVGQFCLKHDFISKFHFFVQQAKDKLEKEVIYQSQEQNIAQVQNSDHHILELTKKTLKYAYAHNMAERLSKPLGMSSIATLKCIRRLHSQQQMQQQESMVEEDEVIQQYSQVIDSNFFQIFQEQFSANPQNPYQLIFNRSVYDTINYLLDECRPYGSKGMPGICIPNHRYMVPTLQALTRKITNEISNIIKIKMGPVGEGISETEMQERLNRSLDLWRIDLIRYIEKQYNYRQEDDTIQRCQLMMEIQQELILQQIVYLQRFIIKRNTCLDLH